MALVVPETEQTAHASVHAPQLARPGLLICHAAQRRSLAAFVRKRFFGSNATPAGFFTRVL
jgi:hypothetical protein